MDKIQKNKNIIEVILMFLIIIFTIMIFYFGNYHIKYKHFYDIVLFISVFYLITIIIVLIIGLQYNKPVGVYNDLNKINLPEREIPNFFTLLYYETPFIFQENGLYFPQKEKFFPYEMVIFDMQASLANKKIVYRLNIEAVGEDSFMDNFDSVILDNNMLYWINKFGVYVKNIDYLMHESKENVTVRFKHTYFDTKAVQMSLWFFLFYFFGIAMTFLSGFILFILTPMPLGMLALRIAKSKKTLEITNKGITLVTRLTNQNFYSSLAVQRLFYPYVKIKKISIENNQIVFVGPNSKIVFPKNKIIENQIKNFSNIKW